VQNPLQIGLLIGLQKIRLPYPKSATTLRKMDVEFKSTGCQREYFENEGAT